MKKATLILLLSVSFASFSAAAQTTKAPETNTSFSISDSASYTGKYKFEGLPFEYITVSVRDGQLYFAGGEYNGFLQPVKDKKDVFDVNGMALFTFRRNDQNQVSELNIDYQGQSFLGAKEMKKD